MKEQNFFKSLFLLVVLCMTFFISNASAVNSPLHPPMGKWVANEEAKQFFIKGEVVPGYTYYYIGPLAEPDSVIAISSEYKLRDTKIWTKVLDMSNAVIRGWLTGWKNDGHGVNELNGGIILAPDGKKVGIWYSHYARGTVTMSSPGVIDIFQPHPFESE